jgi:hypothetical protein
LGPVFSAVLNQIHGLDHSICLIQLGYRNDCHAARNTSEMDAFAFAASGRNRRVFDL